VGALKLKTEWKMRPSASGQRSHPEEGGRRKKADQLCTARENEYFPEKVGRMNEESSCGQLDWIRMKKKWRSDIKFRGKKRGRSEKKKKGEEREEILS